MDPPLFILKTTRPIYCTMVHKQLEIMTEQFLRQSVHVHADTVAAIELRQS